MRSSIRPAVLGAASGPTGSSMLTYLRRFARSFPTLALTGLNIRKWYRARQFGPNPLERSLISAYLRDEFVLHYQHRACD